MKPSRIKQYDELEARIGKTPLIEYEGEVPNGNRIFVKMECSNGITGSHYDRVYYELFRRLEESGEIAPGMQVVETSSGTAGAAFSAIGRLLGYKCHIAIPTETDKAIFDKIKKSSPTIYEVEGNYIAEFPGWMKAFIQEHSEEFKQKEFAYLNHSKSPHTLKALEKLAYEVLTEVDVDYFVPAVGNGASVLGPGKKFKEYFRHKGAGEIIAYESIMSGVAYDKLHPGLYEQKFGIKVGSFPRHKLRGTSYPGLEFPHLNQAITEEVIDEVALVTDSYSDNLYFQMTGRRDFEQYPHWDNVTEYTDFGATTRAGFAVARMIAEKVKNKNIVFIAYSRE